VAEVTVPTAVRAVVFDVNETLSDLAPLRERFEQVGAPGHLLPTWFAGVLRDGIALTAAGAYADFQEVARAGLLTLLSGPDARKPDAEREIDPDSAAQHILGGLAELEVHPDVPDAVRALRAAGLRLATMTNGSAASTERLLDGAALLDSFEMLLDVSGPRAWKPAPAAYRYAVERLGVEPAATLLVAVHPWDVDGAQRAGLSGAWLRRGPSPGPYPAVMTPPARTVTDLRHLPDALAATAR
jgi:2-haloacid dehalogenase